MKWRELANAVREHSARKVYPSHLWDKFGDSCMRCGAEKIEAEFGGRLCSIPATALTLEEDGSLGVRLRWLGGHARFYYCPDCDFIMRLGETMPGGGTACGAVIVHECLHGNQGRAVLSNPLRVLTDFLAALGKRPPADPYALHREKLHGIEALSFKPVEEPLGDAWATPCWEEP